MRTISKCTVGFYTGRPLGTSELVDDNDLTVAEKEQVKRDLWD